MSESEISSGIKGKINVFVESLDQFSKLRSTRKGKKCVCNDEPASVCLHQVFSIPLLFSPFFRSFFVLPNFWSLRKLIKQLFHSRLLDMRLVIANSALRALLAIYHLISNARSWNIVNYSPWFFQATRLYTRFYSRLLMMMMMMMM